MKLSLVLFAAGALASTFERRQTRPATDEEVATVRQALINVVEATGLLNDQVLAFNGPENIDALQDASTNVINVLNTGTETVTPIDGEISLEQGFNQLIDQVMALNDIVATTVDNAIDKKPTLVAACVGPIVLDNLNQQLVAANAFRDAIANKFSEGENRDFAYEISKPSIDELQRGIDNFSDQTSLPEGCETTSAPPGEPTTTSEPGEPTSTPAEPTSTPAEPTSTPAEPTSTPAEPTSTPAEPTSTPAEPTSTPAEPTSTPAEPTSTPAEPTSSPPSEPTSTPEEPTGSVPAPTGSVPAPTSTPSPTAAPPAQSFPPTSSTSSDGVCEYIVVTSTYKI